MKNLFFSGVLLLFAVCVFTGCSESDERRHPLYIKALQDRENGNGKAAAEKLCELLKRRPRSIHIHKLLAAVYDEMLNEPAKAVYHYQAYLQAVPEASDAEEIQAWLLQAEKRLYAELQQRFNHENTLPPVVAAEKTTAIPPAEKNAEASPTPAGSAPDLANNDQHTEVIAAKDKEIAGLKEQLSLYKTRYLAIRQTVEKMRVKTANAGNTGKLAAASLPQKNKTPLRQYKVVAGDTPGSIARKVYGKSSLHYVIMRANPQIDARKLRPGMVLNIPPRQENSKQGDKK